MDKYVLDSLMQRLARGDESAFNEIYAQTKNGIYSYALSLCKNHYTAEDIMQNTYIRMRNSAKSYQAGTNALAWIYTIAKNTALNEMAKNKRETLVDFDDTSQQIGGAYTIDNGNDGSLVELIKNTLDETESQIVFLHLISGFKHREIAEILSKPLGTVLWTYKNALAKIKKKLENDGNEN